MNPRHLLQLAQDVTPAGRYKLANAVSQFFEDDELNQMEHHLVVEIMMSLIRRAELDLREALAEKLSVLKSVPPEVIIFLANDQISVARPVLEKSPVLNDADLVYIISSKDSGYWRSIANRTQLSPQVARRLVDTNDIGTAANLVANPHIVLHKNTVKRLIKLSLKSEDMQAPLLRRPELDAELAIELYACVSQALRHEIAERFAISHVMIEVALDGLVEELSQEARRVHDITPEMATLARQFRERGEISAPLMIKVLRRGQMSFFTALFAEKLGLPAQTIISLIKDDGGKPFAVACRSAGMMKSEFASIFLLSCSLRTGDKVVDQIELAGALRYFEGLRDADVQRQRKEWTKAPETV